MDNNNSEDKTTTYTVDELIARLTSFPHDTKVYMSRDAEGNGYGTINDMSFEYRETDEAVAIYPSSEHIDYDLIFPHAVDEEDEESAE